MKKIILNHNKFAVVDNSDFDFLNQFKWRVNSDGYAIRTIYPSNSTMLMHRLILGVSRDENIDHINRNKLDNRKNNLRVANESQNGANRIMQINNKSGYKGVYLNLRSGKWIAQICINKKQIYIGSFVSKEEAAKAYDSVAREEFGNYARPNFI